MVQTLTNVLIKMQEFSLYKTSDKNIYINIPYEMTFIIILDHTPNYNNYSHPLAMLAVHTYKYS